MWKLSLLLLLAHTSSCISQPPYPLATSYEAVLRCIQSSISCPSTSVIVPRSVILTTLSTSPDNDIRCTDKGVDGEVDDAMVVCQVDVTSRVESRCFGQYECTMEGGMMPKEGPECAVEKGFKFLNISYDCLPIEKTSCFDCERGDVGALIKAPQGYLSSLLAANERLSHYCGTSRCPWLLNTQPGQTINITFIQALSETPERSKGSDGSCSSVVFSASEEAVAKVVKTCPGDQRLTHVHTSVSNAVTMFYNENQLKNIGVHYLVHYEVSGCADIIPPKFSRMERFLDKAVIDCPETPKLRWIVDCVKGEWVGLDELGECPPYPSFVDAQKEAVRAEEKATLLNTTIFNLPVGVMLALVVASAIVLGILVLTMGVVCLKRHNYDLKHKDDPNIYGAACSEFEFKEMGGGLMTAQKFAYQQHLLAQADRQRRASGDLLARDNTYAMQELVRMDTRPLPSLPNNASPSTTYNRQGGPVPYGVYPQSRVAVQFHRADSDVMASGYPGNQYPPRGYMTSRPGTTQIRYPRMPMQATIGHNNDNHLYFVLDGSAPDEKVGTLSSGPNHVLPPMVPPTTLPHPTPQLHHTNLPPPAHNRTGVNTGAAM